MPMALWVVHYGWAVVFIGALLEGETVVLLAAVLAQQGLLDFHQMLLAAALGAFAGDQFFFHLGRLKGTGLVQRHATWPPKAAKALALLKRCRGWVILFYRFIYGMRAVIPFLLGTGICRARMFTALSALSAIIWALVVGAGGYWFGEAFQVLLRQGRQLQQAGFLSLVILTAFLFGLRWWKRRSCRIRKATPEIRIRSDDVARGSGWWRR